MSLRTTVDVLKALGDATRLRLVALLHTHGMLCVCELEQVTGLPQYTISRHLGILRRAGLVEDERDGTRVNYRPASTLTSLDRALLESVVAHLEDAPQVSADLEAAAAMRPATCSPIA